MRNCLVAKLKEVINNDNLPVFEKLDLVIEPGEFGMYIGAPVGSVVTFDNNTDTIKAGADVITSGWQTTATTHRYNGTITKKTHLTVSNVYSMTEINELGANTSHIVIKNVKSALYGHITTLVVADSVSSESIRTADFKNPADLTKLQYEGGNFVANLVDFQPFTSNRWILLPNSTGVGGNINTLIPLKTLENINFMNCAGVEGSVEELVAGQFNAQEGGAARRSGSLQITGVGTGIQYNGGSFATVTATFGENSVTVAGTGVSTKTYDGNSWS